MIRKIKKLFLGHKIAVFAAILVLGLVGYFGYSAIKNEDVGISYVLAAVEKGILVVSVSGSGQVSAFSQIEVKPQASGNITSVYVKAGQEVKSGTVLAQIDSGEAWKSVRDAEINLESAKLSLEKLTQPADKLSLLQAENSLAQAKDSLVKLKITQETEYEKAKQSKQSAEDDLDKAYDNGFSNFSNAFLDLPSAMAGLNDILFGYNINSSQQNTDFYADAVRVFDEDVDVYKDSAYQAYQTARKKYDQNFADYKAISRTSDKAKIEAMVSQSYETTKAVSEAIKSATDLIQFYQDKTKARSMNPVSLSSSHISSLNSYTSKTNTHLTNLFSSKLSLQSNKLAIQNADREISDMLISHPLEISAQEQAIKEKKGSLAELKAGADSFELQAQKISIQQKENALKDAKEKLADYSIRAPFDGALAEFNLRKGEAVSSGSSAATIITKQQIAEISLNEVDVAKVKIGQKTTISFDAVEDLNITGSVVEIDALGEASQGVVSYNVKISFDAQDERIKPGMSASAEIIIEAKQNVLLVPNSAVKSLSGVNYAEVFGSSEAAGDILAIISNVLPEQKQVETGLSNDTSIEIISGLKEGDKVVSRTINSQTTTAVSQTQGLFSMPGGGPSGGSNVRNSGTTQSK